MIRLVSIVPYAIASGLFGAVIVGPVLGASNGHLVALWWLGALLVFAAAAVTMAFRGALRRAGHRDHGAGVRRPRQPQRRRGVPAGLAGAVLRSTSTALPNGAGTDSVRRIVYFGSNGIGAHLLVIAAYAVLGAAVALVASVIRARRTSHAEGVLV